MNECSFIAISTDLIVKAVDASGDVCGKGQPKSDCAFRGDSAARIVSLWQSGQRRLGLCSVL